MRKGTSQETKSCEEMKTRLRALIREKAYKEGEFKLASGKMSSYYINGKMVTLDPEGLLLVSELLFEFCREAGVEAIGGPTIGADPIVAGVAVVSQLRGQPILPFLVRKEVKDHGTGLRIEGPVPKGKRVAMVDDVITTGGSLVSAIEAAREAGCEVVQILCVVDREEGGSDRFAGEGLRFDSIFKISDIRSSG
jgi:orotate phosphoribosyltransferase